MEGLEKNSTGIGLYLSQMAAKKLGHTISVESIPGEGSSFKNRPEFLCSPGGVKNAERFVLQKVSHRTAEMSPDSMVAFPLNCYTDFSTWEGYMKSIRSFREGSYRNMTVLEVEDIEKNIQAEVWRQSGAGTFQSDIFC